MSEATEIVHWPGKEVPACAEHAGALKLVGRALGFTVSSTPWIGGGPCTNCENAKVALRQVDAVLEKKEK